jgi:very-short-patch-repair endonuclease
LTRAVNDARQANILTLDQLRATLARFPIHPGARRLRPHAETTDGATRSEWEDGFPAFCARHRLPRPRLNAAVCGLVVDALFEAERVIVELDSWQFHGDRTALERDRERDAVTAAAGYLTVRLTWRRMRADEAREAARLRKTLARRR